MNSKPQSPSTRSRQPKNAAKRTESLRARRDKAFDRRSDQPPASVSSTSKHSQWTFLTNHTHVLVLIARNPTIVLREVALRVGITERAVQRIISDLEAGGFLQREKIGRQNHYSIRTDLRLRHAIESHRTIGDLLALVNTIGE